MNLSEHFTLEEFIASDTTARNSIDNTPSQIVRSELFRTAALMEQVRTLLCKPIQITSGYRCSALNKLVGSKPTSKHVQGLACDFKSSFGDPLQVCRQILESDIIFGKLILEFYNPATGGGWTHIEVGSERKVLTINNHGTYAGLKP